MLRLLSDYSKQTSVLLCYSSSRGIFQYIFIWTYSECHKVETYAFSYELVQYGTVESRHLNSFKIPLVSSLPSWDFLRKRHFLHKCRIYVPHISLKWTTLQTWKPSFWSADHKNGDKSKYDSKQLKGHISFLLLPPPPSLPPSLFLFLSLSFFFYRPIHFCWLRSIQSSLSYLRYACMYTVNENSQL